MSKYLFIGVIIVILSLVLGCSAVNKARKTSENVAFDKNLYPYLSEERFNEEIIGNQEVLDTLADKNDNSSIKRDVQHYVYFDSDKQKSDFTTESNQIGYKLMPTDDKNGVIITVNSTSDKQTIDKQVLEICNLAGKYSGEYDGWETSVCK